MKQVTVMLSDTDYATLRDAGAGYGMTVTDLVARAAHDRARAFTKPFARAVMSLHALFYTTAEIAAELGVTNNKITDQLRALGFTPWPRAKTRKGRRRPSSALGAMVREGYSDAQIAEATGMLLHDVASRRRALHLPPNRRYRKATTP